MTEPTQHVPAPVPDAPVPDAPVPAHPTPVDGQPQCQRCDEVDPIMSFDHELFDDDCLAHCIVCHIRACMDCTFSIPDGVMCAECYRQAFPRGHH